ncbi:MAG: hypothetical protein IJL07_11215 [Lachnospiraceae bacterium]|nr:hypothetical protein [Lachnospiraceae bacterium]
MEEQPGGRKVKITEIYNDVINENVDYEFINPLLADGIVIREGNVKSPKSVIKLSTKRKE